MLFTRFVSIQVVLEKGICNY